MSRWHLPSIALCALIAVVVSSPPVRGGTLSSAHRAAGSADKSRLRRHTNPRRALPASRRESSQSWARVINEIIRAEAARYRIDPLLVECIIAKESNFGPWARSPKGAVGLMQLMPGTARRFGVRRRADPAESIRGGMQYFVWLLDRYGGNVRQALAGYNAGEGRVEEYSRPLPRETRDYIREIEVRYLALARERAATAPPIALDPSERAALPAPIDYTYRFRLPRER